MVEKYCPIRVNEICRATGRKCDYIDCVERIRKHKPTAYEEKMEKWESHRRGDNRINTGIVKLS